MTYYRFFQANEKEKEKFLEKIMLRQIELAEEHLEHFYFDGAELNKVNVVKIVRNLSGVMTGKEIIDVIMRVLEEDVSKTLYN